MRKQRGLYTDVRVKVLPLQQWMKNMDSPNSPTLEQETPRFNRDGYYLHYDVCWFEVGGKAYLCDADTFLYELATLNGKILTAKEEEAIRYLNTRGIGKDKGLITMSNQLKSIRNIRRHFLGIKSRVKRRIKDDSLVRKG